MGWSTGCLQDAGILSEWDRFIRLLHYSCYCFTDHLVSQEGNGDAIWWCVDNKDCSLGFPTCAILREAQCAPSLGCMGWSTACLLQFWLCHASQAFMQLILPLSLVFPCGAGRIPLWLRPDLLLSVDDLTVFSGRKQKWRHLFQFFQCIICLKLNLKAPSFLPGGGTCISLPVSLPPSGRPCVYLVFLLAVTHSLSFHFQSFACISFWAVLWTSLPVPPLHLPLSTLFCTDWMILTEAFYLLSIHSYFKKLYSVSFHLLHHRRLTAVAAEWIQLLSQLYR